MRWDRLRQMDPEELRWRAGGALRAHLQEAAAHLRAPRWRRGTLARVLRSDIARDIAPAVRAQQWLDADQALLSRLRGRRPRFVLDPAAMDRVRQAVVDLNPNAAANAIDRAERVLRVEYDLLGYRGLRFTRDDRRIDWHFDPVWGRSAPRVFYTRVPYLDSAIGDHKIIWELNRHQHWLTLGRAAWLANEPRYAAAVFEELSDWLDANPPLIGINWASMLEIGLRSISWIWMLHCLLAFDAATLRGAAGPADGRSQSLGELPTGRDRENPAHSGRAGQPWLTDMLIALSRQLTHVEQNLSYYFSPNTHLTGEAIALYVAGTALPELAAAERWAETGRRVLLDEIERQILADGGHVERSTHYQRYTLEFYQLALLTARIAGDGDAARQFEAAAARLAEFTRVMADDEGRLPLIGDDDGGMLWPFTGRACNDVRDALATAAATLDRPALCPWGPAEETIWVAGPDAAARLIARISPASAAIASRALAASGYVVMRDDDEGSHAVFDCGAHGYLNAGHAHADALALTLTLRRRPLLVDPGTSAYTIDARLRDRMRSSASHNTVTIDGRSSSLPAGPFHWLTHTDARIERHRQNDAFDFVEGVHDGYAPVRHHRAIAHIAQEGWLIADVLAGSEGRTARAHWHFAPEWTLEAGNRRLRAVHTDGTVAWLLHDAGTTEIVRGDHEAGIGWYAPVYGTLVPTSTVRLALPADARGLVTWIASGDEWRTPELHPAPIDGEQDAATVSAAIVDGPRRVLFLVRTGGAPLHAARMCRIAEFETDARLLHAHSDGDRLLTLDIVDATRVVARRQGWISIEADEVMRDLHVTPEEGRLDLRTSAPPATLRLVGLSPRHRVRLNGRDYPSAWPAGNTLVIQADDWREAVPPRQHAAVAT